MTTVPLPGLTRLGHSTAVVCGEEGGRGGKGGEMGEEEIKGS